MDYRLFFTGLERPPGVFPSTAIHSLPTDGLICTPKQSEISTFRSSQSNWASILGKWAREMGVASFTPVTWRNHLILLVMYRCIPDTLDRPASKPKTTVMIKKWRVCLFPRLSRLPGSFLISFINFFRFLLISDSFRAKAVDIFHLLMGR